MQIDWQELSRERRVEWHLNSLRNTKNSEAWETIQRSVLLTIDENEPRTSRARLIPEDYAPGTFLISERRNLPRYLNRSERDLGLKGWLTGIVVSDLDVVIEQLGLPEKDLPGPKARIADDVYTILTFGYPGYKPLVQQIWNQEYSDIIRRLELLLLTGQADYELDIYGATNSYAKDVCIELLHKLENERNTSLRDWCLLAVSTGLVGLNEKSSMDATSDFYEQSEVPLYLDRSIEENVIRIYDALLAIIERDHVIDQSGLFLEKLRSANQEPLVVAVLADDYIETIFLLKLYEKLLDAHQGLKVLIIPKSSICGNDATFMDVLDLLELPELSALRSFVDSRCIIRDDGPRIGGLNFLKLPGPLLDGLANADLLDIRGCRAFEMAQGIKKEAFYSFNVIREISESITGLDGESQHLVFIRQRPGEVSFRGFRERYRQQRICPSGRRYMVVPYTVLDYYNEQLVEADP